MKAKLLLLVLLGVLGACAGVPQPDRTVEVTLDAAGGLPAGFHVISHDQSVASGAGDERVTNYYAVRSSKPVAESLLSLEGHFVAQGFAPVHPSAPDVWAGLSKRVGLVLLSPAAAFRKEQPLDVSEDFLSQVELSTTVVITIEP